MTPIEKNVYVVDEQGTEYKATYFKRAKGLVKSGRARFIGENIISLACPPNTFLEDNIMENSNISPAAIDAALEMLKESGTPESRVQEITAASILERIDQIIKDTEHIKSALNSISNIKSGDTMHGSAGNIAEAIAASVKSRETTNQQLIKLLDKMYDGLQPNFGEQKAVNDKLVMFDAISDKIAQMGLTSTDAREVLRKLIESTMYSN